MLLEMKMGKMVNKIEENFFTSNVFTFESYSCHCEIEKVLNIIGEPTEIIKITADKRSLSILHLAQRSA